MKHTLQRSLGLILKSNVRITLAALSLAFVGTSAGSVAFADAKMDAETHTVVIEKLEESLKRAKEDETVSLRPVRSRLADLYADRARLRAMAEAERSCQDCKEAYNDRLRALQLYDTVVKEAPQAAKGPLLLQMAHINELTQQPKNAAAIYERVANEGVRKHEKSVVAEALIGRAEARFSNGKLEAAEVDFNSAIKISPPSRRGVLLHRIAWVHLNQGKQKQAVGDLVRILKNPDLMVRSSSEGESFDASFQEDVARDLATFMARGPVTMKDIRLVESLTPDRSKGDTLKHFASECDRLGQKPAAIDAWAVAVQYEKNPAERLEALVRVAQLRFDLGQRKEALAGMKQAVGFWQEKGCVDPKAEGEEKPATGLCDQLQQRLRKIVLDWNRLEKGKNSPQLYDAYRTYLAQFGNDGEMNQWGGDVARALKRYSEASALYHKSSLITARVQPQTKESKNLLESATVGEIEMAEITKDKNSREAAYDHYLALNPNGVINAKVRYQRAHVAYEKGDSRQASNRFHDFAASQVCRSGANAETAKLCSQAADLDLDSLVLLRDHAMVEARATEYASIYGGRRDEFHRIARTSVLKQTEGANPKSALAKLATVNLAGATVEERVRYWKTRIALGEQAQDLNEVRSASTGLMRTKGISDSDKEFSQGKMAWAAEMSLDFEEAYSITRRMKLSSLPADERAMKLSLLAELAGRNPTPHHMEFLRVTRDQGKSALVRAKLVRSSRSPVREMAKHESYLQRYPQIYAPLAFEAFARSNDSRFAQRALGVRGVVQQPAGQALRRELFFREFAKLDRQIATQKIRAHSDAVMQRSLGDRLKLLGTVEQAGNQAISFGDWPSQLITLSVASRENKRLYGDILALPVPRNLKGAQRQTYIATVNGQAQTYLQKHQAIESKLAGFWSDRQTFDAMTAEYTAASPEIRALLGRELRQIAQIAPSSVRSQLETGMANSDIAKLSQEASRATADAKQRPFNVSSIERLRRVENARGRETMVAYLDARITKMKQGDEK